MALPVSHRFVPECAPVQTVTGNVEEQTARFCSLHVQGMPPLIAYRESKLAKSTYLDCPPYRCVEVIILRVNEFGS